MLDIVEQPLDMDLWQLEGKDRGGAHLPIMLYTNNHCMRSVVALERRKNIAVHTQKKAGSSWCAANSSSGIILGAESAAVAAEWRSNWNASSSSNWTWP